MLEVVKLKDCGGGESGFGSAKGDFGVKKGLFSDEKVLSCLFSMKIMSTPVRDFLLETPWRIIIPNPNVNSHSL
jgi:hypothetical protein